MTLERPMFPPRAESNVITFPAGRPPSNVRELHNSSFAFVRPTPSPGRRRSAASMHTFVFRSYDLILASPEAHLVRDVRCDVDKARTKLRNIREQIERDRQHAAAREDLLTRAEARLAAALAAATSNRPVEG